MGIYWVVGLNDRQVKSHMPVRPSDHQIKAVHTDAGWGVTRLRGVHITGDDLVTFVGQWERGRFADEVVGLLRRAGWQGHLLPEIPRLDGRP